MAEKSKWQSSKKADTAAKEKVVEAAKVFTAPSEKPEPSNVVTSTSLHKEGKALGSKLPAREEKPEQAKARKGEVFVQPSSADAQRFSEPSDEDKKAAKEAK